MPVIGVPLEFGTLPLNEMLSVLMEENALWQTGCNGGTDRLATIEQMMNCFCPDDPEWRVEVWQQFKRRIDQVVEFLRNRRDRERRFELDNVMRVAPPCRRVELI